jgi:uncharacterized protein
VILVDANILVYAHVTSFAQHKLARDWLDRQLNGSVPVGLPWASVLAFLRLVTNPRVFERPEPIGEAWQQVRAWLASELAWVPQPTERHADLLGEFLALCGVVLRKRPSHMGTFPIHRESERRKESFLMLMGSRLTGPRR